MLNKMLKDKVVLITGAGGGIGQACARVLAREGARLALSDRDSESCGPIVRAVREAGGDAVFIGADVTSAKDVEAMIRATVEQFGRLDCAVNNAGVEDATTRLADCPEDAWDLTLDVNLKGVWLCMKYEISQMLAQGDGVIVNMASVAGLGGAPKSGPYVASKHGVVGLTRTAALECASKGIRVNAVCPSYTRTDMVQRALDGHPELEQTLIKASPMRRLGEPEEVAETVLWLCSQRSSFINGAAVPVDGGMTAWA